MGKEIVLTLTGDVNEMSPNSRLHYLERYRRGKVWRQKAALGFRKMLNGHPGWWQPTRVEVRFELHRARMIDECNAYGSGALKAIIDGMVDAGVIPDDSPEWLRRGPVTQKLGRAWRQFPEVVVTVEALE